MREEIEPRTDCQEAIYYTDSESGTAMSAGYGIPDGTTHGLLEKSRYARAEDMHGRRSCSPADRKYFAHAQTSGNKEKTWAGTGLICL
ncbi:hypothetical protein EVAR_71764_1 [Eumeta japonica]|uniref:Uncharacterized protein n=1 Tax=Eumeta variegata TaxID=151549 RepID=A0A4C1TFU8_EUMVA|nr:hypothetical protein EVAR_71764_1 [Eumeta japonica]